MDCQFGLEATRYRLSGAARKPLHCGSYPTCVLSAATEEILHCGSYPTCVLSAATEEILHCGSYPKCVLCAATEEILNCGSYPTCVISAATEEILHCGSYPKCILSAARKPCTVGLTLRAFLVLTACPVRVRRSPVTRPSPAPHPPNSVMKLQLHSYRQT